MQKHLSLLPINMLSDVRLMSESKEWNYFKSMAEIMSLIPRKKLKIYLCNSLINWTWCMKQIMSILKYKYWIFLLVLNSRAPFKVKIMKRPPAGWIADAIKNEIKKKYILSHEYKSIKDEAVKLQKEIEYINN